MGFLWNIICIIASDAPTVNTFFLLDKTSTERSLTITLSTPAHYLIDLDKIYSLSPEDRRSLTITETITADGSKPIPPVIIIQGRHHMESWYRGNLKGGELVLLSEKGFTNNDLTLRWLRHYIQHKQCTPNSPYRLLLMDNHESHRTPEFILLACQHNIILYPFPPHMTHCMQPLDVGVFHPYKYWHNKAI